MQIEYGQHQKDTIAFQQIQPYSICALQTGVGKTVTTIGSELVNLQTKKLDKCIFVCTKSSLPEVLNDYNKFYKFTPKQLNSEKAIDDFFQSDSSIAVTRYEWLKYFNIDKMSSYTSSNKLGMWWDEAQRLKNVNTRAHKYAKELRQYCSAFHAVTATPIMTKLDDLWGLMEVVDDSVLKDFDTFCDNFYERKLVPHPKVNRRKKTCPTCGCRLTYSNGWDYCTNPYCKSIETPMGYVPFRKKIKSIWELIEYKNIDVLSKIMRKNMFCFYPEQDIQYHVHNYGLSSDEESKYIAIAKDTIEKVDSGKDDTPFATRLIQLQYLVDRSLAKRQKLYQLANVIKEKGFVLYVPFYESLAQVEDTLKYVQDLEIRTYSGKDVDEDKDKNKAWFQKDPKNKCLIITQAGGASLNLQVTNQMIFYGLPNGFGAISQAIGRVVRLFSSFKTFHIHFLLNEHTVDKYKYVCFLMYDEIIRSLMNNKMIKLEKPINFNNDIKAEIRRDVCWRST